MPGIALHALLAHQVMSQWNERCELPLKVAEPAVQNSFLAGAMGPDMGYMPGSDALVSDLTHYVGSGDLVRALVQNAASVPEHAFAWGWASHVLADSIFHPLINRAVGEWMHDDDDRSVAYNISPAAHLRIETGLDTHCLTRRLAGSQIHYGEVFDKSNIGFLQAAFSEVYGEDVSQKLELLAAHKRASSFSQTAVKLLEVIANRQSGRFVPFRLWRVAAMFVVAKASSSVFARESATFALTHAVKPSPRLLRETDEAIEEFPQRFFEMVVSNAATLPNYNLDLGTVEDPGEPYELTTKTQETAAALTRRNSTSRKT